jgi:hypothetical protein
MERCALWEIRFGTPDRTACTIEPVVVGHVEWTKSLRDMRLSSWSENSKALEVFSTEGQEVSGHQI